MAIERSCRPWSFAFCLCETIYLVFLKSRHIPCGLCDRSDLVQDSNHRIRPVLHWRRIKRT